MNKRSVFWFFSLIVVTAILVTSQFSGYLAEEAKTIKKDELDKEDTLIQIANDQSKDNEVRRKAIYELADKPNRKAMNYLLDNIDMYLQKIYWQSAESSSEEQPCYYILSKKEMLPILYKYLETKTTTARLNIISKYFLNVPIKGKSPSDLLKEKELTLKIQLENIKRLRKINKKKQK